METKILKIEEFRNSGMLQECNRLFFHRLGLALTIRVDEETGYMELGNIQDFRESSIEFGLNGRSDEDKAIIQQKIDNIESEFKKFESIRGYSIEELNK